MAVPDPPGIVVSAVTQSAAAIRLVPPFDGGSPVTQYETYVDDDPSFVSLNASWYGLTGVATGLATGRQYFVRARALNAEGYSGWAWTSFNTTGGAAVKLSGTWMNTTVWCKPAGTWLRVIGVWKKVNGTWVR